MSVYLAHHGVKGQKWGERKYQYKDGSLTPAGRKRYGVIGSTKAYISQRRKNARDRWKKEDALDTWHDSKVSPVYKKEKSKQISRKEANREYDRYWKEYEGKLLIKRATKNNPNLKLSDSDVQRLIKQASTFGRNVK